MTWLLALLGGGGLAFAGRYLWDRRAARQGDAAELEQVRKLADEDVTLLGEELTRLGSVVEGRELDVETRLDYQRGLDAYEAAQRAVGGVKLPSDAGGGVHGAPGGHGDFGGGHGDFGGGHGGDGGGGHGGF
jgi:hypothetical protein